MKAIVFGGAGFLGSHIADALSKRGHDIRVFDRFRSQYIHDNQEMITGDILDEKTVQSAIAGCDVVYNLAAIADIDECREKPLDTARINILGNSVILEAARQNNVKRYVFASSVYVYSAAGAFYRTSKRACELFIKDYQELFGMEYTILRYGSLYGRRANHHNSIYKFLSEALTTGKITYYGTGEEEREFIHVEDAALASVDILADEYANQHIILTGHRMMRYKEFLEMIQEILGNTIEIEYLEKRSSDHYKLTPYTFTPQLGKKYVPRSHIDIGQGILDCLSEIYEEKQDQTHYIDTSMGLETTEDYHVAS